MNPKVSIIVPVYNMEKYLKRCINSILAQEFTDFELILSDDGSTDSSTEICEKYVKEDSRVKLIHGTNKGVSHARNSALDIAKGEYIQFVDSDDWVAPNATGLLVHTAERNQCDLIISDFYRVCGERLAPKGDIDETGIITREEFAGYMMENPADFYYGVLWNKLYRRDIIEEFKMRMDETISWCEDFMFNLDYIYHAKRFMALQVPIYYYVKRKGSLAGQCGNFTKTLKMKLNVFEDYNKFYKNIMDTKEYEKNRLQVYKFFVEAAGDGTVPPTIFPSSKKLGDEKVCFNSDAISDDGFMMDEYRYKKLMEYYAAPICQKYSVSFTESRLLFYIANHDHEFNRKNLADLIGVTKTGLVIALQKLASAGYIKFEDIKPKKSENETDIPDPEIKSDKILSITLLNTAKPIVSDINLAYEEFENCIFSGFTEEEMLVLSDLRNKIKENIKKVLR